MSGKGKSNSSSSKPTEASKTSLKGSGKDAGKGGEDPKKADVPRGAGEGRGHRQKGAGTVATSKGEVTIHGITMAEWMKTPQTLIQDYCRDNKRPRPIYHKLPSEKGGVRYRLVLQDPKRPGSDKDLIFTPTEGNSEDDEAKHSVALLALFQLGPSLPLERKLPEPYKTFWLKLQGSSASGKSESTDKSEKKKKGGKDETSNNDASTSSTSDLGVGNDSSSQKSAPSSQPPSSQTAVSIVKTPLSETKSADQPAKRVHEINMNIQLTSSHLSRAEQRTAQLEKERIRAEKRNIRQAKIREMISRQSDLFVSMNEKCREEILRVIGTMRESRLSASKTSSVVSHGFSRVISSQYHTDAEDFNDEAAMIDLGLGSDGDDSTTDPGTLAGSDSTEGHDDDELDENCRSLLTHYFHSRKEPHTSHIAHHASKEAHHGSHNPYADLTDSINSLQRAVTSELRSFGFSAEIAADAFAEGLRGALLAVLPLLRASKLRIHAAFTNGYISSESVLIEALDWTCVYVPESSLPPLFSMKGRSIALRVVTAEMMRSESSNAPGGALSGDSTLLRPHFELVSHDVAVVLSELLSGHILEEGTIRKAVVAALEAAANAMPWIAQHHFSLPKLIATNVTLNSSGLKEAALNTSVVIPARSADSSMDDLQYGCLAALTVALARVLPSADPQLLFFLLMRILQNELIVALFKGPNPPYIGVSQLLRDQNSLDSVEAVGRAVLHTLLSGGSLSASARVSGAILNGCPTSHEPFLAKKVDVPLATAVPEVLQEFEVLGSILGDGLRIRCTPIGWNIVSALSGKLNTSTKSSAFTSSLEKLSGAPLQAFSTLTPALMQLRLLVPGAKPQVDKPVLYEMQYHFLFLLPLSFLQANQSLKTLPTLADLEAVDSMFLSSLADIDRFLAECNDDNLVTDIHAFFSLMYPVRAPVLVGLEAFLDGTGKPGKRAVSWRTLARALFNEQICSISDGSSAIPLAAIRRAILRSAYFEEQLLDTQLPSEDKRTLSGIKFDEFKSLLPDVVVPPSGCLYNAYEALTSDTGAPVGSVLSNLPSELGWDVQRTQKESYLRYGTNATAGYGSSVASPSPQGRGATHNKRPGRSHTGPRVPTQRDRERSQQMLQELERREKTAEYKRMREARRKLPSSRFEEEFVKTVAENRVVLLSGATGCGKTTQIPQFILDDAIRAGRGGITKIVCTQPRRIAAIGVASRIAQERCEDTSARHRGQLPESNTVGYQIRGERVGGSQTPLMFATTGIVLRKLNSEGLGDTTHLIIDEVHERNVDTDFLLAVMKKITSDYPHVRLILMSATMDAESFACYFASVNARLAKEKVLQENVPVPIVQIPGFVHPVQDLYLPDILSLLKTVPRIKADLLKDVEFGPIPTGESSVAQYVPEFEERRGSGRRVTGNPQFERLSPDTAADVLEKHPNVWKKHGIDYDLLVRLIKTVASPTGPHSMDNGSILVFLPGSIEIRNVQRELNESYLHVLPLHGGLSGKEQAEVFRSPPPGKKKVVLSTNIAETSITIDDVTVVIDTLRVKETQFDPFSSMSRLVECWTSRASAQQRRGRAGRVRPGTCYRLSPRSMFDLLDAVTTPEIKRVSLDSLILQVKVLQLGSVYAFMNSLIDPPERDALVGSISNLVDVGAMSRLDEASSGGRNGEKDNLVLTSLGFYLAQLPVSVHLGKSLIMGCILRCVDPVLSIVAAIAERSPFLDISPSMDEERREKMLKSRKLFEWGQSDHLPIARAFSSWRASGRSFSERKQFADSHFLSNDSLRAMEDLREELAGVLFELGFLGKKRPTPLESDMPKDVNKFLSSSNRRYPEGRFNELSPQFNTHSFETSILRAVLVAAHYPNLVKIVPPQRKYHATVGGAMPLDYKSKELKMFVLKKDFESAGRGKGKLAENSKNLEEEQESESESSDESSDEDNAKPLKIKLRACQDVPFYPETRVFIHPSSFTYEVGEFRCRWLIYNAMVETSKVFIRNVSVVSPFGVILFGGPVSVDYFKSKLYVGEKRWIHFMADPKVAVLCKLVRNAFNTLLSDKINNPSVDISSHDVVKVAVRLIQYNGN